MRARLPARNDDRRSPGEENHRRTRRTNPPSRRATSLSAQELAEELRGERSVGLARDKDVVLAPTKEASGAEPGGEDLEDLHRLAGELIVHGARLKILPRERAVVEEDLAQEVDLDREVERPALEVDPEVVREAVGEAAGDLLDGVLREKLGLFELCVGGDEEAARVDRVGEIIAERR